MCTVHSSNKVCGVWEAWAMAHVLQTRTSQLHWCVNKYFSLGGSGGSNKQQIDSKKTNALQSIHQRRELKGKRCGELPYGCDTKEGFGTEWFFLQDNEIKHKIILPKRQLIPSTLIQNWLIWKLSKTNVVCLISHSTEMSERKIPAWV